MFGLKKKVDIAQLNDQPDDEQIRLSTDINNKFLVAKLAKAEPVELWKKCIDAYNGDYFVSESKPDYKSDEVSNFVFSTIETIKPIMVDNDPRFMVLPKSEQGLATSSDIQDTFDAEWQRDRMPIKLPQAVTLALQMGTAVIVNRWDGKDENGLGNVTNMIVNPYNVFPDPMATDVESAEYIIYATYKQINLLKQLFPSKANLLRSGTINHSELVPHGSDTSNVKNQVLVLECWMRDYTTYDADVEGDSTKKERKAKYPKGRVLTIAPELNVVLEDKPNPYNDGRFPFYLLKCYDVPFKFWGEGEVAKLLSPQTYINDLMNQIIDNAKLTANMPWVLDKNSGIGKGQLTNRPGLIVRKNPGSEVKRLAPPPMPNYVQEMIGVLKSDIETISGIHDVTQGRKPGSISAASAIMALQEAAQARIRLKVKLMEATLTELGLAWFLKARQFWKTNRWVRKVDLQNNMSFVEMTPEKLQIDVDFVMVAGSTMPTNKNAMLDLMIRLAQTGAEDGLPMVDRETVLQYTNVPDKQKIVKRFNDLVGDRKEQEQKAQQQALLMQQQAQEQQIMQQQQQMMAQHEMEKQKLAMQSQHDQAKLLTQGIMKRDQVQPSQAQLEEIIQFIQSNPELLQALQQGQMVDSGQQQSLDSLAQELPPEQQPML